jgi:hypothetical protein
MFVLSIGDVVLWGGSDGGDAGVFGEDGGSWMGSMLGVGVALVILLFSGGGRYGTVVW